ncbi:galactose mutarotase [Synechococcus sp. RSCCF101]|uniref:aldose epimerase family protein n=1 Tax=Synechococcus sp. RSCCF101 TaxID=2511069 RepID=UPI0012442986|nr:galactose mutarotase [Synechococcus sp. RSCCF101]QEY32450.1 galactose mutarotase [Synechococcus sp. RSCCF101]
MPSSLTRHQDPYPHWAFETPSGDRLRLVPERGGLLSEWRCGGREILYFDRERFADPAKSVRGGMPILFPICGNLPGDRLPLPQGEFHLPQHGFARDQPWSLESAADGSGVRMVLEHNSATLQHYPFRFRLQLDLTLEPGGLAIAVSVAHLAPGEPGSGPMPYSLGLHPYFRVSDPATALLEGLPPRCFDHLQMAETDTAAQLQRLGAGVDLLAPSPGAVHLSDPAADLTVTMQTRTPLDQAVIWSEPPRPMVCLEAWTAPRQALISGERRLELAPGEAHSLHCRYTVTLPATGPSA